MGWRYYCANAGKTWYIVQELRKTVRRINTDGSNNPLTGKLFCADCGCKMHYRSEHTRAGRDWRGLPNGGVRIEPASYNCSTYMNKRKVFEHECSSHFIQEKVIEQIILETIRYACQSVRLDENAFAEAMRSASAIRDEAEIKKIKSALEKQEKRYGELDLLIKKSMRIMLLESCLTSGMRSFRRNTRQSRNSLRRL